MKMDLVHIALDSSTGGSLKIMLQSKIQSGEQQVFAFDDCLAYGPLIELESREGWVRRLGWLGMMNGSDDPESMRDLDKSYRTIMKLPEQLSSSTEVVIWATGHAADQTALRLILFAFRHFTGRIRVIDALGTYDRLQDQGQIGQAEVTVMLRHSGEISTQELREIWEAAAQVPDTGRLTDAERRGLEQEWQRLSAEEGTLRKYWNGRIVTVPESFYDDALLETAGRVCGNSGEFHRAARIIGEVLAYSQELLGDEFLNHRLTSLVYAGRLEFRGVPRQMRMYEVRPLRAGKAAEVTEQQKILAFGSAEELAQRQLDRYNAHDLEGFLDVYAEDAKLYNLLDGSLIVEGRAAMRERYRQRFEVDKVHAELVNRMVIGSRVIDHERVTREGSDETVYAAAIYETKDALIREVWFVYE